MATSTLLTVEDYSKVQPPPDGRWELHGGELVKVTFAKQPHNRIQNRLLRLLLLRAETFGVVDKECPFRIGEYELRSADVAVVSKARWDADSPGGYIDGAPEIVIEVQSPSNSADEIADKEALCLANGAREFWLVNPKQRTVRVSTPDRRSITYSAGDSIPLPLLPGAEPLPVANIFAE
jgi:Uma2 family endonuclease